MEEDNLKVNRYKRLIPKLGKGVYLIEDEYKSETIYLIYIPASNFGLKVSEPLYRFFLLCTKREYTTKKIIDHLLMDFDVGEEELEQDLVEIFPKLEELKIIEFNETILK